MSSTSRSSETSWTRVLQLDSSSWLGLAGTELFVGDESGPKRQIDLDNLTGLLPCLERPYATLLFELGEREAELGLAPGSLVARVPLSRIARAAVASQMDYWVQLGLDWMESMPRSQVETDLLELLERESWPTQRARHRARALRRVGPA